MIYIKPFDYIFYRIATSKFYQKLDSKTPYIWAFGALSFCQLCNVLTIIGIFQTIHGKNILSIPNLSMKIGIPLGVFNMLFVTTEKKYRWLIEKYKNEENRTLKGWFVISYVTISILTFLIITDFCL